MDTNTALSILGDNTGFFPTEYRDAAREIIEAKGTKEDKALASKCLPRERAEGRLSRLVTEL